MFVQLLAVCLLFSVTAYPQNNKRGGARSNDACEKPGEFEEMRLNLQWTQASCLTTQCKQSAKDFTIHGMWPSNNSGDDPEFCCGRPFSMREIQHLQPKLNVSNSPAFIETIHHRFSLTCASVETLDEHSR